MAAGEREEQEGTIADSIAIARGSLRNPGRALKSGLRGLPHIRKKTRMCGAPVIRARPLLVPKLRQIQRLRAICVRRRGVRHRHHGTRHHAGLWHGRRHGTRCCARLRHGNYARSHRRGIRYCPGRLRPLAHVRDWLHTRVHRRLDGRRHTCLRLRH